MASYVTPKKGVEFIFYISMVSQANTKIMQANPTIASGDFKVSIDGGSLANPSTLPAVTPGSSKMVKVTLSTSEMNGDNVTLIASDASGAEWCDLVVNIQTSARQVDDLAYPATSGRSTAIDASGQVTVGAIAANAITATSINADAITAAKIADGAIDAATFATGAITATAIAADAIGASELAADAVTEIQSGLATASALTTVGNNVSSILADTGTDGVVVASINSGAITAAAIATDAIDADALAADAIAEINATVDTALADIHLDHLLATTYDPAFKPGASDALLNELVESDGGVARYTVNALENAPSGSGASAETIADAVWDELLSGHAISGSTGEALDAAGTAGDPWGTSLPGAYGSGTAGKIIGDNINATISSRATQTSVDDLPTNAELATSQASADDATLAAIATLQAFVDTEVAAILAAVDTEVASILADTNELQTDWTNGGRLDTLIDTLITNVAAILSDTGTDGVVISTATRQAIADELLGRSAANVESTASIYTIAGLIFAAFESSISGTTWTINRSNGSTQFATRTVTLDDTADPITGVE